MVTIYISHRCQRRSGFAVRPRHASARKASEDCLRDVRQHEEEDVPSFSLIDQPWIRALRLDGHLVELSILDVFASARDLRTIVGEVPTQAFAILRVLLAILHRAVEGPEDPRHWAHLWQSEQLPVADVSAYLDMYRDRFDLLHPEAPFFQVADLHTAKNEVFRLDRLIADVPTGEPYFTTRMKDGIERISFAEAARWVVHCQAFDPSGIKSGAVGDRRVKGGKGYPIGTGWAGRLGGIFVEGRDLRETLLLNLIGDSIHLTSSDDDVPAWEREPLGAEEADCSNRPHGPLDLYTWQSRRIRLFFDADSVFGVLIANGDRLEPHNKHDAEPMTAWRRSQGQEKIRREPLIYMPQTHDPDRSIWRGLAGILPCTAGRQQGKDGSPSISPLVLEWVGELSYRGLLPSDLVVRTHAIGMHYGSNQATTAEIVDDQLAMRVALLQQESTELGTTVQGAIKDAEQAVQALGNLAANLAAAAGDKQGNAKSQAREAGYAALDRPFRAWIADLRRETDPLEARRQWHVKARTVLIRLGEGLVGRAGPAAWVGRQVNDRHVSSPEADLWFRRQIAKALPLAVPHPSDCDSDTSADKNLDEDKVPA